VLSVMGARHLAIATTAWMVPIAAVLVLPDFVQRWRRAGAKVVIRVARWFILRPKFPIWVYFGGPWNGKCRYILRSFGIFHEVLVYLIYGRFV
jgi:hypothetical protein